VDLCEALLTLAALGVRDLERFEWFEPPPGLALENARALLRRLGALDGKGGLSEIGREMLRFPVHPRLARLIVEGERRGVGEEAAALAALVSEGDISDMVRFRTGMQGPVAGEGADLLERLDRFRQARSLRFARERMRGLGVDPRAAEAADQARRQFAAALRRTGPAAKPAQPDAIDHALAKATLAAFPDRVMRRRSPGAGEALLASGGVAEIGSQPPDDLLCAVDVEERVGAAARSSGRAVHVRLAVGIRAEWLLDLTPDELTERDELVWSAERRRVERTSRLLCGAITLEESRLPAPPSPEASRMLAESVLSSREGWAEAPADLQAKLEVLRQAFPDMGVPTLDAEEWRAMVVQACDGICSVTELQLNPIENGWLANLPPPVARLLREEVPERVRLAGGRMVAVHYQAGQPPWIESRLQDFFGMAAGPSLCRGRVPLTLHLLAPNHRAVQVTSDLANFWRQHYPAIRRELCRRYPRHPWPEDGATATPPAPHLRPGGRPR
ncbi:MAG TPA: ATP-dependent helicase C-terminal domain-containing protein, partial [Polyangia bacterium]